MLITYNSKKKHSWNFWNTCNWAVSAMCQLFRSCLRRICWGHCRRGEGGGPTSNKWARCGDGNRDGREDKGLTQICCWTTYQICGQPTGPNMLKILKNETELCCCLSEGLWDYKAEVFITQWISKWREDQGMHSVQKAWKDHQPIPDPASLTYQMCCMIRTYVFSVYMDRNTNLDQICGYMYVFSRARFLKYIFRPRVPWTQFRGVFKFIWGVALHRICIGKSLKPFVQSMGSTHVGAFYVFGEMYGASPWGRTHFRKVHPTRQTKCIWLDPCKLASKITH